jgi:nitrogen fixation/metabolism regulation signal transduction histidine kinase
VNQSVSIARAERRYLVRQSVGWWNSWRQSLVPSRVDANTPISSNTIAFTPRRMEQREPSRLEQLQFTAMQNAPVGSIVVSDCAAIQFVNEYAKQLLFGAQENYSTLTSIKDIDAHLSLLATNASFSSVIVPGSKRAFCVEAINAAGRRLQVMVSNANCGEHSPRRLSILTICDISTVLERHFDSEENINFVSHDIRFMLNSILLQAEQLKTQLGTTASPVSASALTQISQRAKQSLALAETFLELRLLNHQKSISMHTLDIVEIVASACEDVNIQSREANVKIEFGHEEQVLVRGNFSLLYRATLNVLTNAVRASRAGGRVYVDITLREDVVAISVSDGGPGFPADVLAMFSSDDRMPKTSTMNSGARLMRGLGLQMTRKVAQIHCGTLQLSNASRHGGAKVEIHLARACTPDR